VAVYVHGSLALGCFNPARSDLDVLVVLAEALDVDTKLRVADVLLHASAHPYEIELDALTLAQLAGWRHPSPYDFHYSESHRERYAADPLGRLAGLARTNADLAAHVTVTRAAGIAIVGPPPYELLPEVPFADYRDSLLRDLEWARTAESESYGILSPCRIWATVETRQIHSKVSGAHWALERLPADLERPVAAALATYVRNEPLDVAESLRLQLFDYVAERLRQ